MFWISLEADWNIASIVFLLSSPRVKRKPNSTKIPWQHWKKIISSWWVSWIRQSLFCTISDGENNGSLCQTREIHWTCYYVQAICTYHSCIEEGRWGCVLTRKCAKNNPEKHLIYEMFALRGTSKCVMGRTFSKSFITSVKKELSSNKKWKSIKLKAHSNCWVALVKF